MWILGFVAVTFLLVMTYQSVKAFHVVLRENVDAIGSAGIILMQDTDVDVMEQEIYEKAMIRYGSTVIDSVQAINGISENVWIYKKYKLQNFENFVIEKVLAPEQDIEQMKENHRIILQIQENIQKAEGNLWESDNGLNLLLRVKRSSEYYFAEIESICAEWSMPA